MTQSSRHSQPVSIERPRAGDRLSHALRAAYGDGRGLPADMAALLTEIDWRTANRRPRRDDAR
ncbi:hypothetical protein ACPVPU_05480 [Sphingomonas sp. CJ99]